jgi:hypothetical protein
MVSRIKVSSTSDMGPIPPKAPVLAGSAATVRILGMAAFMTVVLPIATLASLLPDLVENLYKELGLTFERAIEDWKKELRLK